MEGRASKEYKSAEDPGEGPVASLAIVLRMPIAKMPEVFSLVQGVEGVRVVYQRTSAGRLTIVEDR